MAVSVVFLNHSLFKHQVVVSIAMSSGGDAHGEAVEGAVTAMPPREELAACLHDLSRPIAQRMRAIFYLRTLGGSDAVEALCIGTWRAHRRQRLTDH